MSKLLSIKNAILSRAGKIPHLDLAVLAVAIATYVGLVWSRLSVWSIWFDEAFTAYITRFNFADIAHYTSTDMHPPFYYWLVKAWASVFGTSDVGFRSLSMVLGVGIIILGFVLLKKLFSKRVAMLGVVLLALSPMLVRYGVEARMYMLVTVIALAATYVLHVAMEKNRRKDWVIYGVLIALGMWTHYYIALVWLAHWAWRFMALRVDGLRGRKLAKKFFSKQWILVHVLAIAIFSPWIMTAIHQFSVLQAGFWIANISADTATNYLTSTMLYLNHDQVQSWLAMLFYATVIGVAILVYRAYRNSSSRDDKKNLLLLMSLSMAPPLILALASMPPLKPSFVERYLIPSIAALMLLFAVAIVNGSNRKKPKVSNLLQVFVALSIIGMFTIGIKEVYYYGNYNKNSNTAIETKQLINSICEKSQSGEPIIADSPWVFYEAVFYSSEKCPVYFLNQTTDYIYGSLDMLRDHDDFKIKDLTEFTKQHPKVWYFGYFKDAPVKLPDIAKGWQQIDSLSIHDPITDSSPYKAAEFETSAKLRVDAN